LTREAKVSVANRPWSLGALVVMRKSFGFWLALTGPGLLVTILGGAVSGNEALKLGPLADADVVDSYHFGAESMVGVGGYRYVSRDVYVRSTTVEAICLLVLTVPFVVSLVRRNAFLAVGAYAGVAALRIAMEWWHI